ncbi:MAG: hypothetical protein O3B47_05845, partial [bacterium]|nr:hypothetical protein [bacterium]
MKEHLRFCRNNISLLVLGAFWLLALFNPVFKKYDYGAGFPVVIVFSILIMFLALIECRKKGETAGLEKFALFIFVSFFGLSFIFSETRNVGFSEVLAFSSVSAFYLVYAHRRLTWIENFLKILRFSAILAVLIGFFLYLFRDEPRMIGPFFNTLYH